MIAYSTNMIKFESQNHNILSIIKHNVITHTDEPDLVIFCKNGEQAHKESRDHSLTYLHVNKFQFDRLIYTNIYKFVLSNNLFKSMSNNSPKTFNTSDK